MSMMGFSCWRRQPAFSRHWTPWRSCLTAWDSAQMWPRWWAWLVRHFVRLGGTLWVPMDSRWQGRDKPTRTSSSRDSDAPILVRTWRRIPWRPADRPIRGWPGGKLRTYPPQPAPILGQNLPDIIFVRSLRHFLPGEGMPGEGDDPRHTLCTLHAPPYAGHVSDPGKEEPPPLALSQVWHFYHTEVAQHQAPGHVDVRQGRG